MKELYDFSSLNEAFGLPPCEPVWVDWNNCETIHEGRSAFEGKKHTEETKQKMSKKRQGVALKSGKYIGRRKKGEPFDTNENYVRKTYLITSPAGVEYTVKAMGAFCKEHNLQKGCMCRVANGERKQHKQWTAKVL